MTPRALVKKKRAVCATCEYKRGSQCVIIQPVELAAIIKPAYNLHPHTVRCPWVREIPELLFFSPRHKPTNYDRLKKYANANIVQKAISYAKALLGARVSKAVYEERLAICRQCKRREVTDAGEFCRACGCGQRPAAELKKKLKYAAVECPAGYFDKVESKPGLIARLIRPGGSA